MGCSQCSQPLFNDAPRCHFFLLPESALHTAPCMQRSWPAAQLCWRCPGRLTRLLCCCSFHIVCAFPSVLGPDFEGRPQHHIFVDNAVVPLDAWNDGLPRYKGFPPMLGST